MLIIWLGFTKTQKQKREATFPMDQGETHMDKTIRNSLFYSYLFLKNMTQKKKEHELNDM